MRMKNDEKHVIVLNKPMSIAVLIHCTGVGITSTKFSVQEFFLHTAPV